MMTRPRGRDMLESNDGISQAAAEGVFATNAGRRAGHERD